LIVTKAYHLQQRLGVKRHRPCAGVGGHGSCKLDRIQPVLLPRALAPDQLADLRSTIRAVEGLGRYHFQFHFSWPFCRLRKQS
jgi:hypothetical protein